MTIHLLPRVEDDAAEHAAEREHHCDRCADQGCAKCDPDMQAANHLAWALDLIAGA